MRDEGETVDLAKMLAELPQGNPVHVFLFIGTRVYKDVRARKWPIFKDIVVILLVVISIICPGSDFFHWSL